MSNRRSWYTGLVLVPRTVWRTMAMFHLQGLGRFLPLIALLLIGSALLWMLSSVAPLAPFIYSLF